MNREQETDPPDDEALRSVIAARVQAASLRDVAARVGMSHSGLHRFLLGASVPMPRTRRKLVAYCLGRGGGPEDAEEREIASLVLRALMDAVPVERRRGVLLDALRALGPVGARRAEGLPAWVAELYAELDRLPPPPAAEGAGEDEGDGRG